MLGELAALPKLPSWIYGPSSMGRTEREGKGEGKEGKGDPIPDWESEKVTALVITCYKKNMC